MASVFSLSNFVSFQAAFHWVIIHGYWIIFLGMLIEGPIVTAAAGFAAALGYFSPYSIFILALAGDIVPDVAYYAIGYWGRMHLVERFGKKFGLTRDRMDRIANLLHSHPWKTLLALKLAPIIPTTGLMLVGVTKMPLKKYVTICSLIILPKTIAFELIGYFLGQQYDTLSKYVNDATYLILAAIGIIILINYLWGKISAKTSSKIEKL